MRNATLFAASAAVLLLPALGSANLLTNSGFDTVVNGPSSGYKTLITGSTDITGWTVGGTSVDVTVVGSYPVVSNPYSIDLAGTPGPGSVSQLVNGTSAGFYTISFYGQATGIGGLQDGIVEATFAGITQSFQMTTTMALYSFNVYNIGGNQTFTLSTTGTNTTNGNIFVDDASVTAVPAPAAMSSFGLTALASLRRRRAKRA